MNTLKKMSVGCSWACSRWPRVRRRVQMRPSVRRSTLLETVPRRRRPASGSLAEMQERDAQGADRAAPGSCPPVPDGVGVRTHRPCSVTRAVCRRSTRWRPSWLRPPACRSRSIASPPRGCPTRSQWRIVRTAQVRLRPRVMAGDEEGAAGVVWYSKPEQHRPLRSSHSQRVMLDPSWTATGTTVSRSIGSSATGSSP